MGWETPVFKANVRKLKALGLTQSLETGYRLTDLGEQVAALMIDGYIRLTPDGPCRTLRQATT